MTILNPPPSISITLSRDNGTLETLSVLEEARAGTEDGLTLNHNYVDYRGCSISDIRHALEEEQEILGQLAAAEWTTAMADEILDTEFIESFELSAFGAGMGAAVVALSAAEYTPISSCNGGTIGSENHSMNVPNILFAAGPQANPKVLWKAIIRADLGLVANGEFAELFAEQVLKFHKFSKETMRLLVG